MDGPPADPHEIQIRKSDSNTIPSKIKDIVVLDFDALHVEGS